MVFVWLPEDKVPLAVDEGIQLPQLELINNSTGDCTSVYSTGKTSKNVISINNNYRFYEAGVVT